MQIRILVLGFFSFLLFALPTQAAILFSTSFDAWQNDMTSTFSRHLDHATFETNYANIAPSVTGEIAKLPDPSDSDFETKRLDWNYNGNNVDLGRTAIFNKADTNFGWSFEVGAIETDKVSPSSSHNHGTQFNVGDTVEAHVFYNDRINRNNFDQVNAFTDVLSIGKHKGFDTSQIVNGDPYAWDNDDFSIEVTSGPALYALAFEIVNNKKYVDTSINPAKPQNSDGGLYSYGRESITITDINNQSFEIKDKTGDLPVIPGYYNDPTTPEDEGKYLDNFDDVQFIGIVSDTPFTWLEFNEDSRSDDIGIRNLRFAGIVESSGSPVPLPAAFWMLLMSLISFSGLGLKRKQRT